MIKRSDGTISSEQNDIEVEVMEFYKNLMGKASQNLTHTDVTAMRRGEQLSIDQRKFLIIQFTNKEIQAALQGIGDLKSPGVDGFGSKFFKASWHTIKGDVSVALKEFFQKSRMYKEFNKIIVTLIPKSEHAMSVKEYILIAGCTTCYKVVSKILSTRLGKVLKGTISFSQASFIPGHNIRHHIMLAYELIKGCSRKNGTPRCTS